MWTLEKYEVKKTGWVHFTSLLVLFVITSTLYHLLHSSSPSSLQKHSINICPSHPSPLIHINISPIRIPAQLSFSITASTTKLLLTSHFSLLTLISPILITSPLRPVFCQLSKTQPPPPPPFSLSLSLACFVLFCLRVDVGFLFLWGGEVVRGCL